jgi:4-carboxymuconolactone decarboxylase
MKRPSGKKGDELAKVAPGLVEITDRVLYGEVWERPGLSPRDRSLITIAALLASHKHEQLPSHLGFGLDNGLTKEELGEAITHLAFYASWPSAISAARKLLDVVEARDAADKKP